MRPKGESGKRFQRFVRKKSAQQLFVHENKAPPHAVLTSEGAKTVANAIIPI
jgi:hypothetical protein